MKLHTSMSFRATILWRTCPLVLFLGLVASSVVFGQAKNSPVAFANEGSVTTSLVPAPSVASQDPNATPPSGEPGQWLKVEFHYGTTPLVTDAYPYLDEVQFKVWIEGLDLYDKAAPVPGKGVAVALTGSVTYVNVPMGKDIYGVFYVPPSILKRYSSERGPTDFDQKFDVHVEAYIGGTLVDAVNKNKEADALGWFKPLKPVAGVVYRQDQCPFMMSDTDRYPTIKLPDQSQ